MIRHLFLLLLLAASFIGHCQKGAKDYYDEAFVAGRDHRYPAAIAGYRYVVDKHPTNVLCADACYNLGKIYMQQGRKPDAIKAYRQGIDIALRRRVRQSAPFDYSSGYAAYELSNIYDSIGNCDSALFFLGMYDTVFPRGGGCATAAELAQDHMTIRYADINLHAHRVRPAEQALLARSGFVSSGSDVTERLRELFKEHEDPVALRSELANAINGYFFDTVKYTNGDNVTSVTYCCITFMDTKIRFYYTGSAFFSHPLFDDEKEAASSDRATIINRLKQSQLYSMVQRL